MTQPHFSLSTTYSLELSEFDPTRPSRAAGIPPYRTELAITSITENVNRDIVKKN